MKHNGNAKAKKPLRIGFIMDPMEKLLYKWDTSIQIMRELEKRGHQIFYFEPEAFFYRDGNVFANARQVSIWQKKRFSVLNESILNLNTLNIVFNRKEPPFDSTYLYITQLLDLLAPHVFVLNSPEGLRKANEKLYILNWKKWIPASLVTNQTAEILEFQKRLRSDVILKPLDQKGGKGIQLLKKNAGNKSKITGRMTQGGKRFIMAQKFISAGLKTGDKRILILDGKIIGYFRRLPKRGEFRANLSLGGTSKITTLTRREKRLAASLRPKLKQDGLYFVGIDVVDGYLIEVNVTSPAGIGDINALAKLQPEVQVADFLEAKTLNYSKR